MSIKTIKRGQTKSGNPLVLALGEKPETMSVWERTQNYSHGRMVGSWRYILLSVPAAEAEACFKRRNKAPTVPPVAPTSEGT